MFYRSCKDYSFEFHRYFVDIYFKSEYSHPSHFTTSLPLQTDSFD